MMLNALLSKCGLNQSEQTVLLYLLNSPARTAGQVAKRTGLKRPTVYAILESLTQVELVTREVKDGVTHFSSIRPSIIPRVLKSHAKKRFDDVDSATDLLKSQLEKFSEIKQRDFAGYEISTLGTSDAVYSQLGEVFLEGDFCGIFNPQISMTAAGREVVLHVLEVTAKTQPNIRELAISGPDTDWYESKISNPNHTLKRLPAEMQLISDMIFVNNSVVLSHFDPDRELGIRIRQQGFYTSMLAIFEYMWAQAE
ncbi:MAG: MarR family transcriptional regulator [Deltaproteobacteria bacterium]|nr:MarR family transcriptional regulator [Deltaproteobacteria bacterium]